MTWIPTTKTSLIKEIKYLLPHYTLWEIERVYEQILNAEPKRAKYYARKAALKRLTAWLIQIRLDIKEWDRELKELKYDFTVTKKV